MADIDLKAATPDTTLPSTGFLFGADSQAAVSPSVYSTQTVATALLGSTSLTGETITTSQPVLNLAQTWNAGAVTFTGLRFNATDTASASASLLMDLQVGGSSLFAVRKDNSILFSGGGNNGRLFTTGGILSYSASAADFAVNGADNVRRASIGANGVRLISGAVVDWSSNANGPATANVDLILRRRGTANLQLGAADAAAPVAQTLSVQSVVAGTSNTAGANLTITGSQGTGTGAGGSIIFQVAPAGSSGTAQNALTRRLAIVGAGSVVVGDGVAALATTATDGFIYVPTCAGTPTGTPTTQTGAAPIVIDTTNNKLYFYSAGQWRDAGP